MGQLKNLKVDRVSFVKNPANKRKFLLLKSLDSMGETKTGPSISKGVEVMRDELRKAISSLVKGGINNEATLIAELKKMEDLRFQEDEIEATKTLFSFAKDVRESALPVKKESVTESTTVAPSVGETSETETSETGAAGEAVKTITAKTETEAITVNDAQLSEILKTLKDVQKENENLRLQMEKSAEQQEIREVVEWLGKACPYLPANALETAQEIVKIRKTSPEGAKYLQNSLQKASEALSQSAIFEEYGSSRVPASHQVQKGAEFIQKFNEQLNEIKKSGQPAHGVADMFVNTVKSFGPAAYESYRREQNQRARLHATT